MTFTLPRFFGSLGVALCAVLITTAPVQAQGTPQTVTDLAGRTVTLPAKVDRILLGEGRLLPALGVFERDDVARRLVGMMGDYETLDPAGYAQWRSRFPQLDKVPRVGRNNAGSFSDEQAIALRPQVAILGLASGHGPSKNDRETLARLEAAGIAVVFIDFRHDPLRNTPRSMELLGAVLGKRKEADAFNTLWRAQLERVESRLRTLPAGTRHPSVFLENRVGLADDCCATMVGLVGVLLDAAGAENVARGRIPGEHGTLNPEFLIATQPRLYIGTGIGSMATTEKSPLRIVLGADATPEAARASLARATQRRGIAQLEAVQQNGRAHAIWHHYYNSPFNVVAVQVFAKWLHPALFADLDPRATLQTLFTQFQPIPLTGVYWTSL
ncbi:iron ABC transporter substrate-binding protein [Acidovorax sp. Root267]|uniref:ABC transporter substrate-binding protein n=1 Tax=Acidovorax sp. Root267 TaxID=1736505 RepID=UPI00070B1CC5|nr:ABC transporter substrate-binding protein [Acidovorax sp. Root267]KRD21703.1 iron ABC transporter substrate-binding protein [Acidovorax sp. Root267]